MEFMQKTCSACKRSKDISEFYLTRGSLRPSSKCKQCSIAYSKAYARAHPEKIAARLPALRRQKRNYQNRTNKLRKLTVLTHYARGKPECECCHESHIEFLCLDHINGGGGKQRKELAKSQRNIYWWVTVNSYPDGFRVLCHNCNMSLGFFGYCPHQKKS